ncbi:MAG: histidine kinase [Dehalococcoidales bacterium]|nr:histidine kinase [Dehalococcoidales bacterium]
MKAARTIPTADGDTKNVQNGVISRELGSSQSSVETVIRTEQERIAAVLHDEVLQAFATCLLKTQLCERLTELERYDLVRNELPLLEEALNDTIDRVRELAATLKKPRLE